MSDAKAPKPTTPPPDEDLLEFLGGIDEVNDENQDEDFSGFLADVDIEKLKDAPKNPPAASTPPVKDEKP